MLSIIIHTYKNPAVLDKCIASIKNYCGISFQIITVLQKSDPLLPAYVKMIEESDLAILPLLVETGSFSAQVNAACFIASNPLVMHINDCVVFKEPFGTQLSELFDKYRDDIFFVLINGDIPVITKRASELLGYFYFPLFACCQYFINWLGSIFYDIHRYHIFEIKLDLQNGTEIKESSEMISTSMRHFNSTGDIRNKCATNLCDFLQGEE